MAKLDRPCIVAGNDTTLYIRLKEFIEGEYVDFDLTQVSDLKVELLCAKDNYHYEIPYKIDETYNNLIICDLKHTYYHSNTSYGIRVVGTNEDGKHWTWCMMPREGFVVVSNTSGLHLTDEAEQLSYNGLVGWGISYTGDLTNYYTKTEVDNLIAEIELELGDYYTKDEISELLTYYPTREEIDNRFINYYTKTQTNSLLSAKQDTLVSGSNIKTINNLSLLGSGNIDIQAGGDKVQSDWTQNDTTDPSYIKNKPNLSQVATSGSYNDLTNKPDLSIYATKTELNNKQDTLISGSNIKTINNESILGEGNIDIQAGEDYSEQFKTTADALWDLDNRLNRSEYVTNKKLESIENSTKDALDEFGDNVNEQLSVTANTFIELLKWKEDIQTATNEIIEQNAWLFNTNNLSTLTATE